MTGSTWEGGRVNVHDEECMERRERGVLGREGEYTCV